MLIDSPKFSADDEKKYKFVSPEVNDFPTFPPKYSPKFSPQF